MHWRTELLVTILILLPKLTTAADGCGSGRKGKHSVRCGEECTGNGGYCTCGDGNKIFDYRNDTAWCCNASQCTKNNKMNITCKYGTLLPLSTPCQGKCNNEISYFSARQYLACDNKDQCIKLQHWQNTVHHCKDRSDERKPLDSVYSEIDWDKIRDCNYGGQEDRPGLTCHGQGVHSDCLEYHEWCNYKNVLKCRELGGRTSVHDEICSNNTFWTLKPCTHRNHEGKRCSSGYSGQCYYPTYPGGWLQRTCKDGSHDMIEMSQNGSCPSHYFSCLVGGNTSCLAGYLHCDLHPQCDDGLDEDGCKFIYKRKRLTKSSGTRPCFSLHYGEGNMINKPTVEILALSCDGGQPECAGGVDEIYCNKEIMSKFEICKYPSGSFPLCC